MDIHVLRPDPSSSGGDDKVIEKIAHGTIYSRRWVIDILLFIAIVSLIILMSGQRTVYKKTLEVGKQNTQILEEIKSCTDPAGACAKRGQQSTATVVGLVKDISIYAAYCAAKERPPVSADVVRACVEQQLAK